MIENGFAGDMELLKAARRVGASLHLFDAFDKAGVSEDFFESWQNYAAECTASKMVGNHGLTGHMSSARVDSASALDVLRFFSDLYGTEIYPPGKGLKGELPTCSEAWEELRRELDALKYDPQLQEYLASSLGMSRDSDPLYRIGHALSDLNRNISASAQSGFDYMIAAMSWPIWNGGLVDAYARYNQDPYALMANQAILQRDTQWAAEETMFKSVMRPMMAFFEGFIYAIAPLMGFLIVIGGLRSRPCRPLLASYKKRSFPNKIKVYVSHRGVDCALIESIS